MRSALTGLAALFKFFICIGGLVFLAGCTWFESGDFPKLTSQQVESKSNYGYLVVEFKDNPSRVNEILAFTVFYNQTSKLSRKFIVATVSPDKQASSFKVYLPKYDGFVMTSVWIEHRYDTYNWSAIAKMNVSTSDVALSSCGYENGKAIPVRVYSLNNEKAMVTPYLSKEIRCVADEKPIRGGHY